MASRADWMSGRYGMMVHYLPPEVWTRDDRKAEDLDTAVDHFNVDRFMETFDRTGADWLIFTFGQNTGFYCAPNPVIERYAGPGHCSRRDLMLELAQALRRRGKKLIGYLPCEVNANTTMHAGFRWNVEKGTDQSAFQARYLEMVRWWAEHYGDLLAGWWFDGCYEWEDFHNRYMRWDDWFAAARAGNPECLVTFNDGCFCVDRTRAIRPGFDYYAGEITMLLPGGHLRLGNTDKWFAPNGKYMPGDPGCLWHALVPVDALWAHKTEIFEWLPEGHPFKPAEPGQMEAPSYSVEELRTLRDDFCGPGGAVTFNISVFADGSAGEATVRQLEALRR